MESLNNQHAPILIMFIRPYSERYIQEDNFRSKFKDAPIVVYHLNSRRPLRDEEQDLAFPHTPTTHPLVWCDSEDNSYCPCSFCRRGILKTIGYYSSSGKFDKRFFTGTYQDTYHRECIEPMKNNPYHPKHSLQPLIIYAFATPKKVCFCCFGEKYGGSFYHCSICNFSICYVCANKPVLLTIDQKKRHEHTLSYIPREASMTCDVCALDDRRYFIYVCHQCDFVVHKECINSPSIIKISRHEHRLSFAYSFLRENCFCGVCHQKFDENYGGYSCVKGCYFVAHSRCATNKNVWDRKELEGVPESNAYDDMKPFEVIGDGIIQHFSHSHAMRLHKEIEKVTSGESIRCQACTLAIYEGDAFSCMECDFVLHKGCAYLPLKIDHATHPHPLVLEKVYYDKEWFRCSACRRPFTGFVYMCNYCRYYLDVHCALISEPLDHQCHPHLLFIPYKDDRRICSICQKKYAKKYAKHLVCGECEFVLCFRCATLPKKFMYKHDEHPLIFSYEQDANDQQYWCDVCETKAYLKNGIYTCHDCDVTLHVECLFGKDMFILPPPAYRRYFVTFPNKSLTRPVCARCHDRCRQNKIFYIYRYGKDIYYCSLKCRDDNLDEF